LRLCRVYFSNSTLSVAPALPPERTLARAYFRVVASFADFEIAPEADPSPISVPISAGP